MWVAVDVMSGELGPETAVHGCMQAVREFGSKVILVGDPEVIHDLLYRFPIDSDHCDVAESFEVIGMNEMPARAVRSKKNASVMVAARMVKEGRAVGFFSPGNTGATMAAALWEMGRIKGVERPAIATQIPREEGVTVLMDSGANVDCKAEWLVQFGIMGATFSREILGITKPRVGLLSNGEESKKGDFVTLAAHRELLRTSLNFVGNIEGRDIYGGERSVDVLVCDGFIGNIVLKATEGLARTIFELMKKEIHKTALGRTGAMMLRPTFQMIKDRMDYAEYGGAPLLGVQGNCIIGHGSSNAKAFKNAVRAVEEFGRRKLDTHLTNDIRDMS
ncbi:MAG: phosphate acyltransferase PlsX [Leptospiraceae bacterium]|nr:phosphate acyltransferase PlsX [Leptospiraceae bacterium]